MRHKQSYVTMLLAKNKERIDYMSQDNYIRNLLNIKDKNIKFYDNLCYDGFRKGKTCKIINAFLSYVPNSCNKCGACFESGKDFEKKGFDKGSYVVMPSICKMDTYLFLKKQRIKCLHCNSSSVCKTDLVGHGCFISNVTKQAIAVDLTKKRSEKDIAIDNNVSPNTVQRVVDSYYEGKKLYKHYLPEVLSFDEFKSVKSASGAMSFIFCDGTNGKIIDIVEDRRLHKLISYFSYYTPEARNNVKFIVIDMYSPYISLINKMFPNASIIIDKFHLVQLISRSLNKTRIMAMKRNKNQAKNLKRYWRLILKNRTDLDCSQWKKFTGVNNLMTEVDLVDFLVDSDKELKNTYNVYQDLLYSLKHKDFKEFERILNYELNNISEYMKISIKTLKGYTPYIKNTFENNYSNGFLEGNNNFIKVLKRIAFGFRSFTRFKARIMICKGIILPKLKEA